MPFRSLRGRGFERAAESLDRERVAEENALRVVRNAVSGFSVSIDDSPGGRPSASILATNSPAYSSRDLRAIAVFLHEVADRMDYSRETLDEILDRR